MKKLRKLVVLDRIILLERQWAALRSMCDEMVEYAGLTHEQILKKLDEEANHTEAPICWTQLAQEEMTERQINERVRGADGIITCWTGIPDSVLLSNPQLKYLGFWTNLAQHRVNLELAAARGIRVTYIPDYGTDSVAEMTLAGILAVSRQILPAAHDTKHGSWTYELLKTGKRVPTLEQIPQRMLRDKTLGLVGFGRIGQRVAEIALAFGMRVQYWSREARNEWASRNVHWRPLSDIFSQSEIVSVHLSPYAPAKIVSEELLRSIPTGGIFVNTSAGRLVDQEALWRELRSSRITAYIDVYETIPPRKIISQLVGRNLFTYRAGWFTQEAVTYKGDCLVNHLKASLTESAIAGDQELTKTVGSG